MKQEKIKNFNLFLELLDSLEILLDQYNSLTNQLSSIDMEEIEEIDSIFIDRDAIISGMDELKPQISGLIEMQATEISALIRKMLMGEPIGTKLDSEQKLIQQRAINLRSLQNDILTTDENNRKRMKEKYDEIKNSLVNLQNDKKKINFYSNAKLNQTGSTFNNLS